MKCRLLSPQTAPETPRWGEGLVSECKPGRAASVVLQKENILPDKR